MRYQYKRNCPLCGEVQTYRSAQYLQLVTKHNKRCRTCARNNRKPLTQPLKSQFSNLQYRHVNGSIVRLSVKEFAALSGIPLHKVYSEVIHNGKIVDGWSVVPSSVNRFWR